MITKEEHQANVIKTQKDWNKRARESRGRRQVGSQECFVLANPAPLDERTDPSLGSVLR